jgi:hypothetical protein
MKIPLSDIVTLLLKAMSPILSSVRNDAAIDQTFLLHTRR